MKKVLDSGIIVLSFTNRNLRTFYLPWKVDEKNGTFFHPNGENGLVDKLFDVEGVETVAICKDAISIEKGMSSNWKNMTSQIQDVLLETKHID